MKKYFLIFFPVVLFGCGEEPIAFTPGEPSTQNSPDQYSATNQVDANGYRQGWWILYGADVPESALPADAIVEEGNYRDDKRDDVWTYYNTDGTKNAERTFRADVPDGLTKLYDYASGQVTEIIYRQGSILSESTRAIAAIEIPMPQVKKDSTELIAFWHEYITPLEMKEEKRIREIISCPLQGNWGEAATIERTKNQPNPDYFFANYDAIFTPGILMALKDQSWKDIQCYERREHSELRMITVGTDDNQPGLVLRHHMHNGAWKLGSVQLAG